MTLASGNLDDLSSCNLDDLGSCNHNDLASGSDINLIMINVFDGD